MSKGKNQKCSFKKELKVNQNGFKHKVKNKNKVDAMVNNYVELIGKPNLSHLNDFTILL